MLLLVMVMGVAAEHGVLHLSQVCDNLISVFGR